MIELEEHTVWLHTRGLCRVVCLIQGVYVCSLSLNKVSRMKVFWFDVKGIIQFLGSSSLRVLRAESTAGHRII